MYDCGYHRINYSGSECPRCEADRRHEEMIELASEQHEEDRQLALDNQEAYRQEARESDHRRANPGDYDCPNCRYVTLLRNASRCPLCHGRVGPDYWTEVAAREEIERKARAKRAKETAKEAAKERARLAKIAARRREREEAEANRMRWVVALALLMAIAIVFQTFQQYDPSPIAKPSATDAPLLGQKIAPHLEGSKLTRSAELCSLPGMENRNVGRGALSADGSVFAACISYSTKGCNGNWGECREHRVMAWNVNECRLVLTHDFDCTSAVGVSADGRQVAVGGEDGTVQLWSLETARTDRPRRRAIEVSPVYSGARRPVVVAFSEDQRSLLVGYRSGMVELWGIESGHKTTSFSGHTDRITRLAFQPSSTLIASASGGSSDYTVRLWDAENGRSLKVFRTGGIPGALTFSTDGKLLAITEWDQIRVIDVESRRVVRKMDIPYSKHGAVEVLSFSPDASALFGFRSNLSFLWDVDTGLQVSTLRIEKWSTAQGSAFVDQRTLRLVYSRPGADHVGASYEFVVTTLAF